MNLKTTKAIGLIIRNTTMVDLYQLGELPKNIFCIVLIIGSLNLIYELFICILKDFLILNLIIIIYFIIYNNGKVIYDTDQKTFLLDESFLVYENTSSKIGIAIKDNSNIYAVDLY